MVRRVKRAVISVSSGGTTSKLAVPTATASA